MRPPHPLSIVPFVSCLYKDCDKTLAASSRGSHLLRGVLVSFQCLGVIDEKTSSCRRSKPILAEINKCLLRSYFPLSAQYSRQCLLSTADALGLVLRHPSLGSTPSPVWRGPSSIRDATTFAHQLCAARAESRVTVRRERHCKRAEQMGQTSFINPFCTIII